MNNSRIIKISYNDFKQIDAISMLHFNLLRDSDVSRLGLFFMKHFYYNDLIRKNLIDAYIYQLDNKAAGFIVCTVCPFTLMKLGIRKSPFKLLYVLSVCLILNPLRLFTIIKMLKDKLPDHMISEIGTDSGQFMSFGVLDEYRNMRNKNGKTIAQVLMENVFGYFREKGKNSFFLLALKTNSRAINFYKKYNPEISNESAGESIIIKFRTDNA